MLERDDYAVHFRALRIKYRSQLLAADPIANELAYNAMMTDFAVEQVERDCRVLASDTRGLKR